MTIYFANEGNIDLDTIRIMGVSVKTGDNPIGYFGTGLKYALATLIRTGHDIVLKMGDKNYIFESRPTTIRGEEFNVIYMNNEKLAFTDQLGKDWLPWQAFRELYANCIDEEGVISEKPQKADTVWKIAGEGIAEAYYDRAKIFLSTEPAWTVDGIEVHRGTSRFVYYRGVRAYETPESSRFTYNILTPMTLTEDRTLKSFWDVQWKLAQRLPMIADPEYCRSILNPSKIGWDGQLDFTDCSEPSEEFLDVVQANLNNETLSESARKLFRSKRNVLQHPPVETSDREESDIIQAIEFIKPLNCTIRRDGIIVVDDLGPNIMGMYKDGQIYITLRSIASGIPYLGITLYEEWVHKTFGYSDKSLGMQQHLFDKIMELLQK